MENDLENLFTYGIRIIDDIKDRQQGLDYLRQIIEKINNSNKELKEKLCKAEKKVQDLINLNKEKDRKIQLLEDNENKLNKEINSLNNENDELYEENEDLKKYEAIYYKQEENIQYIKSQLDKKDSIISKLDEDLKNKQKEIEEKDHEISSLKEKILGLKSNKGQGKLIEDYLQKIDIVEGSIKALLKDIRDIKLDRKNENLPEVYVNNVENKDYNPNENFGEQEEDKDCQAQSEGDSPSSYDGANKIVTG